MRKSSLGRRSSTHIPVRVPSIGGNSQSIYSGGKQKNGSLLKPGFSSQIKKRRSQSEDRESCGGRPTLQWSNTVSTLPGRGLGAMTPITPRQSVHANLPTSSRRPNRGQSMSTGSVRRESSYGGTKNARKDSRPINEKSFQQAAQLKVQQYFDEYGTHILGPGNKIRPMNTKLFVDMMDGLLKNFDSRIFITKSNYLEELPVVLRKIGYRSKIDRSWLMTVNTPHSWQHVVAVLSWLVDALECVNCVDPFEMMFPNNMAEPNMEEDNDNPLAIDKEVIFHLRKTYKLKDDPTLDEAYFTALDSEYFDKQIVALKCTDEDFEVLRREIDLVQEEIDKEMERKDLQLEIVEKLKARFDALLNDFQRNESFVEKSKHFVTSTEMKVASYDQEIAVKRSALAKKQEELQKLKEKISCQQISVGDKEKLHKERQDFHRMIQFYENAIRGYDNSVFSVDLKFAEDQRKLEKLIVEYNKLIAEKYIAEPRLKDVEVKFTLLAKTDDDTMQVVDENLKALKEENKNSLHTLGLRKEEAENILWRVKQDKKKTEEEITKEKTLVEAVESDLKKQEELINKSEQKYKEEIKRSQKIIKEITEEISQFDETNLENKKKELKQIEHDWELVQKKCQQRLDGEMAITQEIHLKLQAAVKKVNKISKEFVQKHL